MATEKATEYINRRSGTWYQNGGVDIAEEHRDAWARELLAKVAHNNELTFIASGNRIMIGMWDEDLQEVELYDCIIDRELLARTQG